MFSSFYKQLKQQVSKADAAAMQFPPKQLSVMGAHLSHAHLAQREKGLRAFVGEWLNGKPAVMDLPLTVQFLSENAVNTEVSHRNTGVSRRGTERGSVAGDRSGDEPSILEEMTKPKEVVSDDGMNSASVHESS